VNFKNLTKQEIATILELCHFTIKERDFFDMCDGKINASLSVGKIAMN
jgi:hypothetical protein